MQTPIIAITYREEVDKFCVNIYHLKVTNLAEFPSIMMLKIVCAHCLKVFKKLEKVIIMNIS